MKKMTLGEFKSHFSDVADQVKAGVRFAVEYGRKEEIVGYFVPEDPDRSINTRSRFSHYSESTSIILLTYQIISPYCLTLPDT